MKERDNYLLIHNKVISLIEFYKEFKRCPTVYESYNGINVGYFYVNIKSGNTKISIEDKQLIENEGISIKTKNRNQVTHQKVLALISFYNLYKRKPSVNEMYEDINVGQFYYKLINEKINLLPSDKLLLRKKEII